MPHPYLAPHRRPDIKKPVLAAIDLGTNNCRLLVAEPQWTADHQPAGVRVVDAFSRVVRLGEGVAKRGVLGEPAMERTIAALKICADKLKLRRVTHLRAVATEACRQAANVKSFLVRVRKETGLRLEVIDTQEEARLTLIGCAPLLVPNKPYGLMFDIGGGSTELLWLRVRDNPQGSLPAVIDQVSAPMGVVNLTEQFGYDYINEADYETMVRRVQNALASFAVRNRVAEAAALGQVQLLGSSGTVTTIAAVAWHMPRYVREAIDGSYLNIADGLGIARWLRTMNYETRARQTCVGRDRADLVIAGCAIFEAITRLCPIQRLRIGDRGLREGMLQELLVQLGRPQ